jgi:hypothetical protein
MAGKPAGNRHFSLSVRLIANQLLAAAAPACARADRSRRGGLRARPAACVRDPRGGQNRPASPAAASLSVKRESLTGPRPGRAGETSQPMRGGAGP